MAASNRTKKKGVPLIFVPDMQNKERKKENAPHLSLQTPSQPLTTHATLSTQPGVVSSVSFLALPSSHSSFSPNHTCLFACLLIGFCSGFAFACFVLDFCFSDFLSFFGRDLCVILIFCIFVCCSLFCEFLDFLHIREILVLVGLCGVRYLRMRT